MIVSDLKQRLESFHARVVEYRKKWNDSLEDPLPDYPATNIEHLNTLSGQLLRELGLLRPYLEDLHGMWTLEVYGRAWNVLDMALGNHAAAMKGPSLNALVDGLQIALGRLDDYPLKAEFRIGQVTTNSADIELAELVCSRIGQGAQSLANRRQGKAPLELKDEYDGQDLLHAVLRCYFKYPVRENPLPKVGAAASTRADLSIDELGLIVEAKFARGPSDQGRIEREIAEDLVFYTQWEKLRYLFFVIFKSADLQNAELLDRFSKPQTINGKSFQTKVINV